jgi:hypothetical protein
VSTGGWVMAIIVAVTVLTLAVLLFSMARSIRDERDPERSLWREFGLSFILLALFLSSWIGQGVAQWQHFTDEERTHGEDPEVGDFISEFGQSTLENWQSEFLQLFSFVTLAALYIHKGSGESKDGDDKVEASLRRIEEKLDTLPKRKAGKTTEWQLPETPLQVEDAKQDS